MYEITPNLEIIPGYDVEFNIITERMCSELESTCSRFCDFTGDGIDDLIYSNYVGGEEMLTVIWEKQDTMYRIAGSAWGEIAKILVDTNSNHYSFVIVSGLCCDGFIADIKVYSPILKNDNLNYIEKYRYRSFGKSFSVDNYEIIQKKRLLVNKDTCCLRSCPKVDNEYDKEISDFEDMPVYGNIIARLKEGGMGTAYAKFKDESENLWFFVALDTNARVTYNRFYRDTLANKCGWIEDRFLEFVE